MTTKETKAPKQPQQDNPADYAEFDGDFQKEKSTSPIPDGKHVLGIKGLRRHTTKAGDLWVTIDAYCVASIIDGVLTREFQNVEFEIQYFLPKSPEKKKVREMNIDFCKALLATTAGQAMPMPFSTEFENWKKLTVGLHFVAVQKTGDKGENGKAFCNYYPEKPYTLTEEDRKMLGASGAGQPATIPF